MQKAILRPRVKEYLVCTTVLRLKSTGPYHSDAEGLLNIIIHVYDVS